MTDNFHCFLHHFDSPDLPDGPGGLGGKGRNLLRLRRAGFPVPDGFCVAAAGYAHFVDANQLGPDLAELAATPDLRTAKSAHAAAVALAPRLAAASLPDALTAQVRAAYRALQTRTGAGRPVAVRSSTLSEDGAAASSAGVYESYLQVRGEEEMLAALLNCYRSLWSRRAVQYRAIKGLDGRREAMAVVIIEMVPAEVAGVTFTCNPLNGNPGEMVINATWGLGEALVSGRVTPDNYLLRTSDLWPLRCDVYEKTIETVPDPDGGSGTIIRAVPAERARRGTLDRLTLQRLGELCRAVEQHYGAPQDIEWAIAGGKIFLLQSRPITAAAR